MRRFALLILTLCPAISVAGQSPRDQGDEPARIGLFPLPDDRTLLVDLGNGRLTVLDPRQGQLVELRFFGGLSIEETAEVMQLSPATIKREWSSARAWLRRELSGGDVGDTDA